MNARIASGLSNHLWPMTTLASSLDLQSSRTAKTVVLISFAAVGMSIKNRPTRGGGGVGFFDCRGMASTTRFTTTRLTCRRVCEHTEFNLKRLPPSIANGNLKASSKYIGATCSQSCRAVPPVYRSTFSSTQLPPDTCATVSTSRSCVRKIERGAMDFGTIKRGLLNAVTGKGSLIGLALAESK